MLTGINGRASVGENSLLTGIDEVSLGIHCNSVPSVESKLTIESSWRSSQWVKLLCFRILDDFCHWLREFVSILRSLSSVQSIDDECLASKPKRPSLVLFESGLQDEPRRPDEEVHRFVCCSHRSSSSILLGDCRFRYGNWQEHWRSYPRSLALAVRMTQHLVWVESSKRRE